MLLAVDIGTRRWPLEFSRGKKLLKEWRIRSVREKTADEYGNHPARTSARVGASSPRP